MVSFFAFEKKEKMTRKATLKCGQTTEQKTNCMESTGCSHKSQVTRCAPYDVDAYGKSYL